jgi:hypothetical protein
MAKSIATLNGTNGSSGHLEGFQALDLSLVDLGSLTLGGSFNVVGFTNRYLNDPSGTIFELFATECQLSFCVKLLSTSTSLGNQHTVVTNTWNSSAPGNSLEELTFPGVPSQYLPRDELLNNTYQIGTGALIAAGQEGLGVLNGTCDFSEGLGYSCSSDYLEGIIKAQDYNDYIENIATYLTNTMRQTAPTNSSDPRYDGTAVQQIVVWYVRWPWIIFPALLLLISMTVFIVAVIMQASPTPAPWKADPFALLSCHVDERIDKILYLSKGNLEEARKKLKHERGVLEYRGNRWTIASLSNRNDTSQQL